MWAYIDDFVNATGTAASSPGTGATSTTTASTTAAASTSITSTNAASGTSVTSAKDRAAAASKDAKDASDKVDTLLTSIVNEYNKTKTIEPFEQIDLSQTGTKTNAERINDNLSALNAVFSVFYNNIAAADNALREYPQLKANMKADAYNTIAKSIQDAISAKTTYSQNYTGYVSKAQTYKDSVKNFGDVLLTMSTLQQSMSDLRARAVADKDDANSALNAAKTKAETNIIKNSINDISTELDKIDKRLATANTNMTTVQTKQEKINSNIVLIDIQLKTAIDNKKIFDTTASPKLDALIAAQKKLVPPPSVEKFQCSTASTSLYVACILIALLTILMMYWMQKSVLRRK